MNNVKALTPSLARRLQIPTGRSGALVSDVDPNGSAAGFLRSGDVILAVNGRTVSGAQDARAELQKVPSGRTAIFAPGLRGVDPRLAATVAITRGWFCSRAFSISLKTSSCIVITSN